ncbi:MAG: hypothetical protein IJH63_00510 [Methanobrevibacter sp.]|nr:hypothetical protein [Methanosphaera sp.]MBR0369185.1 hypothetical protein [Methanobrevibacter sp.]
MSSNIRVSRETKHRLKGLSLTDNESYNNIILRLLDVKLDGREIDYLISDNHSNHELKVCVDWGKSEENILYYNSDGDLSFDLPLTLGVDKDWDSFIGAIQSLENIFNIMAVLGFDERIEAGDVSIKRIS